MKSWMLALSALCCTAAAASAQDLQPMSTTAIGVTGPVRLAPTRLQIGKVAFPLALVARGIKTQDDANGTVSADLYRVTKPMDPVLSAPNRFCGAVSKPELVRWLFIWRDKDGTVTLSPSSAVKQPTGNDDTCGSYSYSPG